LLFWLGKVWLKQNSPYRFFKYTDENLQGLQQVVLKKAPFALAIGGLLSGSVFLYVSWILSLK